MRLLVWLGIGLGMVAAVFSSQCTCAAPPPIATPTPVSTPTVVPTATTAAATAAPASPTPPVIAPAPTPTPIATATPQPGGVDFALDFQVEGSGLSRTVNASLTNTGAVDAHNIRVEIELWSGTERLKINGQDRLIESVGTLRAGETETRTLEMGASIWDGIKLQRQGGTVRVQIRSDEKAQTFEYRF